MMKIEAVSVGGIWWQQRVEHLLLQAQMTANSRFAVSIKQSIWQLLSTYKVEKITNIYKYSTQTISPFDFDIAYTTPFEVGVTFDNHEICTARTDPTTCESQVAASNLGGGGGILGFSLCYVQHTPPITV